MNVPLRLDDLYKMRNILEADLSPDGRYVAYVLEGYRPKENDRYKNLWLVTTDGQTAPHRLTRGATGDSSPRWSPDGRFLAFLSSRPHEMEVAAEVGDDDSGESKDKEPKPQIWVFDREMQGEPRQVTFREEGVMEFDWSPDSKQLVFSSRDPDKAQGEYLKSIRGEKYSGAGDEKGPLVIDRVLHKHDTIGFLDTIPVHLFIVDVSSRQVRNLTNGPCDEREPRWSPDGKWIVFASNRTGDADSNRRIDLWLVSPGGESARRLTHGDLEAAAPRWSPDGSSVAFTVSYEPENPYLLRHVACVKVQDATPVDSLSTCVGEGWSSLDSVVPDEVVGDPVEHARRWPVPIASTQARVLTGEMDRMTVGEPLWVDDERVLALMGDRGQTRLADLPFKGDPSFGFPVNDRLCTLRLACVRGDRLALVIDRPEQGPDLFSFSLGDLHAHDADERPLRLTRLNEELLGKRLRASYKRVSFTNSEEQEVEGFVVLPPGYDPEEGPYPLISNPHGGPMHYDAPDFQFDVQYWAGQGYIVLLVNYRGSTSYGEEFCASIRADWGNMEHDDMMSGIRHLIDLGWADPARLFCTGFSYGGIMTNWAVGHEECFRAAVTEHSVWNNLAGLGVDDCQLMWQDDLGMPWHNLELYRRTSPAAGITNIRTPLLITAGEVDWRCPLTQSEELYLSLKKRGVPTQLIVYQKERHAITRPKRAIDRLERICRWFAQYGGQPFTDESAKGYPDPR